jgi:hypothetical protein
LHLQQREPARSIVSLGSKRLSARTPLTKRNAGKDNNRYRSDACDDEGNPSHAQGMLAVRARRVKNRRAGHCALGQMIYPLVAATTCCGRWLGETGEPGAAAQSGGASARPFPGV